MKGAREEKLKEIFTFYVSASNFLKRSLLLKRITILIVKNLLAWSKALTW